MKRRKECHVVYITWLGDERMKGKQFIYLDLNEMKIVILVEIKKFYYVNGSSMFASIDWKRGLHACVACGCPAHANYISSLFDYNCKPRH